MAQTAEDYTASTRAEHGHAYSTLTRILSTVETTFEQAGVPLPTRRFVAVGDVGSNALTCEMLSVNLIQVYLGTPGEPSTQPAGCMLAMSGDFVVQLVRCVPTPRASRAGTSLSEVSVENLLAIAEVEAIDAQLLLESGSDVLSAQGRVASVAPAGVEGGFQAVNLNLSVSLFE